MKLHINGEPVDATEFAYDGCHKIYLIDGPEDRQEMLDDGYGECIFPISELPDVWDRSCGLKFINSADLKRRYVEQFEDAEVTVE